MKFSIDLLGLRLGFSASEGPASAALDRYVFPGLPRDSDSATDSFHLPTDGDDALVLLQQEIDEHVVLHASGFAFVHSGVIALSGAAALLIAPSGHGKSTIVEELVARAGADYYSDEYAAIDTEGRVHPYPRSLLLRSGRPLQHAVTPHELGARVASKPADIRLVLQLPFSEGEQGIRVAPIGHSDALHLLLTSTPQILEDRPEIFATLAKVAGRARTLTGVRGEAPQAARAILELLSA